MLLVPPEALPHLVAATRQELSRQENMRVRADEGEWPEGYDGNDALLFEMALRALEAAQVFRSDRVDLSGKALHFLTGLLPNYVKENRYGLTDREYEALREVYQQMPVDYAGEFPLR